MSWTTWPRRVWEARTRRFGRSRLRARCWGGWPAYAAMRVPAVPRRTEGQAMLETIERAGLFLAPLDEVREWWRYHQLFANLLRARLRKERPGREPVLHRNAAVWHEDHGLADDAVRHAVAAGE